jgi:hypothetical protein
MDAENWNVLIRKVIQHHVGNLTVDIHQPEGLACIENTIELWVLVYIAFSQFR